VHPVQHRVRVAIEPNLDHVLVVSPRLPFCHKVPRDLLK
jgi:hypothetical protein